MEIRAKGVVACMLKGRAAWLAGEGVAGDVGPIEGRRSRDDARVSRKWRLYQLPTRRELEIPAEEIEGGEE